MTKRLKKLRKELEKWLNIPHILLLNKRYVTELKTKDELIEEYYTKIIFLQTSYDNLNSKYMKLKKKN